VSSRAMLLAGAITYGVLVFCSTAALGFVALPTLAYAAGLFAIEAEARGAFSLITLKAVPFLAGLSAAAALSYEWLAAFSIARRVAIYSATTSVILAPGAAVAVLSSSGNKGMPWPRPRSFTPPLPPLRPPPD